MTPLAGAASCRGFDIALSGVAAEFAQALATFGTPPDAIELELRLRLVGSPYVRPRAWAHQGEDGRARAQRLEAWLEGGRASGERRCGFGTVAGAAESVAVVAVDTLADLDPLPLRARVGSWLTLGATLLVPASGAKVIVLGPSGAPRPVPTAFDGRRVRAPFALDRPGRFLIQVLAEVEGGPRPVLEALVFAGIEPPKAPEVEAAPGEQLAANGLEPAEALARMLSATRESEGLPPLVRKQELDRVALEHAQAMRDARRLGHDIGTGDPVTRVERAFAGAGANGENVALAPSATLAHRKLYASPSHRANMLSDQFDSFGLGAVVDPDGMLWVCQVFVRGQ